jgi:predicted small secreted protein
MAQSNLPVTIKQTNIQKPYTNMITLSARFVVLLLVTSLLAIVSMGCNTAHGFGKDVTKTGNSIQKGTR